MLAILKRPDQSASVHITIDEYQQLEQLRTWVAPKATVSLSEIDVSQLPDYSKLSAQDYVRLQTSFANLPRLTKPVFATSTYFLSCTDFQVHCSSDQDFKATWAPYLD